MRLKGEGKRYMQIYYLFGLIYSKPWLSGYFRKIFVVLKFQLQNEEYKVIWL